MWAGCAASLWLAYECGHYIWHTLFHTSSTDIRPLLSHLLHTIELLILIPLPGIVGVIAYRNLAAFAYPSSGAPLHVENEIALAKRLIMGLLAAVAGTRMLVEFLDGNADIMRYASGAILIGAVTLFITFALPRQADSGGHRREAVSRANLNDSMSE
jgi:hypothetical protein